MQADPTTKVHITNKVDVETLNSLIDDGAIERSVAECAIAMDRIASFAYVRVEPTNTGDDRHLGGHSNY